jgi:hypothetical protein
VNPRNTGILFVVALVVVGGVWWNENVRKGQAEVAEAQARELFPDVTTGDVTFVALETTDGRAARLERRDDGFRLVEPLDFAPDRTAVDGIVGALAEVKSEAVIESPQDEAVYGLGEGADVVRFGAGDAEHVLHLGGKTPVGSNTYARRDDDPAVYTIPTFRANALRRSLDDLRDKRVLSFDREAIDRVDLSWRGGEVALVREDDGWRVVAPLEDDADDETVDALLSDLSFLRADGFVDDPPPDPEIGLDRPVFEARLTAEAEGEGEARIFHLLVGDDLGGNERAARGRESATFRIPNERLDDFPRRVAAYRFKQLASFVPSDARQLEIAFPDPEAGAHVVIAEHGEDGWTSSPELLAPGRAARMVAELSTLHGSDIVADAMSEAEQAALGLVPGHVVLRVRGEAGAEGGPGEVLAEVVLGEADHEHGIAARALGSDRIYRIDYELAEHLPISLEALRNRFLSKEEAAPAAPDA